MRRLHAPWPLYPAIFVIAIVLTELAALVIRTS